MDRLKNIDIDSLGIKYMMETYGADLKAPSQCSPSTVHKFESYKKGFVDCLEIAEAEMMRREEILVRRCCKLIAENLGDSLPDGFCDELVRKLDIV